MRIEQCEYEGLPTAMVRQARREGADLDQTLKSPWTIFRAVRNEKTVGFIGVLARTPSISVIRGWYVAPTSRGHGIGTALLQAALDYAHEQDASKVEIRTSKTKMVERHGFNWTGYEREGGNKERHFVRHTGLT